jgi:hypothetical protein
MSIKLILYKIYRIFVEINVFYYHHAWIICFLGVIYYYVFKPSIRVPSFVNIIIILFFYYFCFISPIYNYLYYKNSFFVLILESFIFAPFTIIFICALVEYFQDLEERLKITNPDWIEEEDNILWEDSVIPPFVIKHLHWFLILYCFVWFFLAHAISK